MNGVITIVRRIGDVGIDCYLNGYEISTGRLLKRAVYHGRMVYLHGSKQIGLHTLKNPQNWCRIYIDSTTPV